MASHGVTASGVPGSSSSSDDEGWQDDIAEDLETFVRLSKAGHFSRAEDFFRAFLESHAGDFAVAAQYAENLIEQGSFAKAETFLCARLSNGDVYANDEQRLILSVLLVTVRLHTKSHVLRAVYTAKTCLKRLRDLPIAEDMSPLEVSKQTRYLDVGLFYINRNHSYRLP